jgi:hypothetical protein
MVDMMTINAAVQSGNVLWRIITASKQLIENSELVAAVSEVNTKLMSAQAVALNAQQEQLALAQRIRELEQKIVALEDWNREAERYELGEARSGIPAYIVKSGMEKGERAHPLCANCFSNRKKSFLQYGLPATRGLVSCSQCKGQWFPGPSGRSPG